MDLGHEIDERVHSVMAQARNGDRTTREQLEDLVRWGFYGQKCFSQFGMGLSGYVFRHSRTSVRMTVKVVESGVSLVAFVTAATTMGSIEHMFYLLESEKLKWQKDKYPWI